MLAALRRRVQAWARPRATEALPVRLDRRRIYVLPTGTGVFFAALLVAMLLGALNFNNNPALLLALLLAGAAQASLIAAHMQLSGVGVTAIAAEPVPAGEPLQVRIAMDAADGRRRRGLRVAMDAAHAHASLDATGTTVDIAVPTQRRGWLPLPRLTLSTVQPLGLARAWAYVRPATSLLVYPAPEVQGPPLPQPASSHGQPRVARSGDDPHHLRDYRAGDAPRMVAWKATARHASLMVRDFETPRGGDLVLDWAQTAGLEYESRIRRLARWIDDAERQGRRYGLVLPGNAPVPLGAGASHRHDCLRALALLPAETRHV